jgi:hypothetical protein
LRFTDKTLAVKETAIINGNDIVISHQKNSNTLAVHNSSTDIIIQKVVLYNMIGQTISTWKVENQSQENTVTSKCWCICCKTTNGTLSKKNNYSLTKRDQTKENHSFFV